MVANMWAGDIRNKTDVTVMGSDMVKNNQSAAKRDVDLNVWNAGYLRYFFKHTNFKYIMLATVAF